MGGFRDCETSTFCRPHKIHLRRQRDASGHASEHDNVSNHGKKFPPATVSLSFSRAISAAAGANGSANDAHLAQISGNAGQANYAAAKAGLIGFTKTVAREYASRGITCNAVAPGFIETNMTAALGQDKINQVVEHIPLGRMGQPEDIAAAVIFFAGPGEYVTGQVLKVDGGLYI